MASPRTTDKPAESGLGENTKLFEVCWEVTKRSGGIYTVVRSKAATSSLQFPRHGDYTIIAPYVHSPDQYLEFEIDNEGKSEFSKLVQDMDKKHGIKASCGRWLVKGYPAIILLDVNSSRHLFSQWKRELNQYFGDPEDKLVEDSIIFGFQLAILLQEYQKREPNYRFVAHFHEWMSSVGSILLKRWNVPIATIFTTHATILGRYLSAARIDFYNHIERFNPDKEAGDRLIFQKHWIEKEAAHMSHVFTTVSEITGYEATHLLSRKPDVLLPNGLQVEKFTALHEFQNLHAIYKEKIHEFCRGHFYPYDFDLDNTLYFFVSGRYEMYNKGMDVFIEALARLNWLLKQENSPMTVVGFIITNGPSNNFNVESLKGQTMMKEVRKTCDQIVNKISSKLYEATAQSRLIEPSQLFDDEDIVRLKNRIHSLKLRSQLPPVVTHNMSTDNDEILNQIRNCKLFNNRDDRVKIVYHPEFLSSLSPLLPMEYTEFVRGCHLGVFPSYYEPWGYTPAECAVLGVPSITTNLSGFGNFIYSRLEDPSKHGIFIADRRYRPHITVDQVTDYMLKFCHMSRRERIELRNKVERLSEMLDWNKLHSAYTAARKIAIERAFEHQQGSN